MKRKTMLLLLSAMAVGVLASCGGGESSSNVSSEATTSESQTTATSSEQSKDNSSAEESKEESESISEDISESASEMDSSQEQQGKFAITANSDNIATITPDKENAEEGEMVSVEVSIIAGYILDGIAVTSNGVSVLTSEVNDGYEFEMPSGDVIISAQYHRESFDLTCDDPYQNIQSIVITPVGGTAYDFLEGGKVEFEALVTVSLANTEQATVTGVSLKGETTIVQYSQGGTQAQFRMLSRDVEIQIETTVKDVELSTTDTDHLSATFLNESGEEIEWAAKSETIYVLVESSDPDRYSPATIQISYILGSGSSTEKKDIASSYDESTGLYSVYVPNTSKLTLSMTERDAIEFQGSIIVGNYLSTTLISKNANSSKENDWLDGDVEIKSNGEVLVREDSYQLKTVDDDAGVATLTNYSSIYYGDKFVLVGNGNSGALTTPFGSYDHLWVKKQDALDDDELYTNSLVTFTYENQSYRFLQVLRDGLPYASCYIDMTNSVCYFDVTFNFVNATSRIHDAASQFEVISDGEVLMAVGYKEEGNNKTRIIMSGVYGDYSDTDEHVISFLGEGHALYEGVTYSVDDNSDGSMTLSSNTKTLVVSIDNASRTFEITSEETVESTLAFKGHLYRGSFYNPWDEVTNYFFMSFDANNETFISCVGSNSDIAPGVYSYGAKYMSNNTAPYGDPLPQAYTYDAPTGTLTATIFDCATQNGKTMRFVYSQAQDTFTCQNDYSSNMYKTQGMVMTLVA